MKILLAFLVLLLGSGIQPVQAQDLFDRSRQSGGVQPPRLTEYRGRDRLDLRATASLPKLVSDSGSARLGVDAVLDSDFACGKFDLKATLKNLVGKEARDDYLKALIGSLESQLTYNALVLACEASPTACQAFQHFRVNANAMLGVQYDRCQAIESAVKDGLSGVKAQAIKDCVEEKRKAGKTMSEAIEACNSSDTIRALDGSKVKQIDLLLELKQAFGMDDVEFGRLQTLLSPLKLGPSGAKGELRSDGALRRYDALNAQYQAAWARALEANAGPSGEPSPDAMKALVPAGQPGVLPAELRELAQLPESRRRILLGTLASQAALFQLTLEVQELERKLAALRKSPQLDQDRVRQFEREAEDLRLQLRQIDERLRRQEDYAREFLKAADYAAGAQDLAAREAASASGEKAAAERFLKEVAPRFGTLRGCKTADCGRGAAR